MSREYLPATRSLPGCLQVEFLKGYKGDYVGVAPSKYDYAWVTLWESVGKQTTTSGQRKVRITRQKVYWKSMPNCIISPQAIPWSAGLLSKQRFDSLKTLVPKNGT